jgi:hypothetical protein
MILFILMPVIIEGDPQLFCRKSMRTHNPFAENPGGPLPFILPLNSLSPPVPSLKSTYEHNTILSYFTYVQDRGNCINIERELCMCFR